MEENTLIRCGAIFDGVHDDLQPGVDILIERGKIAKVGRNLKAGAETATIDLTDMTVTPGMIDAHTHLSVFEWRQRAEERIYTSPAWKAMAVLHNAEKALRRGFTTLRFVGCDCNDNYGSLDAKRAIARGYFTGADLVVAPFYVGSTGGMADSSRIFADNPELSERLAREYPGVGSGRDFFVEAVREQAKMGADFIKVMANGGFSNPKGNPGDVQLSDEEYEAIIETAHRCGIPVTAHAYVPETIRTLVKLGIDGIEHGSLLDEATAGLMAERGVYLVPTFCQYDEIVRLDEEALARREPREFREKLRAYGAQLAEGRKIIARSDLKLGYGSDILDRHNSYDCGYEYKSWLESGIDPFRALRAATSVNAEILGRRDIGTIEAGKRADLAGWKRDLLSDPEALLDCSFVMKNGIAHEAERSIE